MGASEIALMQYVLLPGLGQRLTPEQVQWMRAAFGNHPVWLLPAILAVAAVLTLPVLLVTLRIEHLGPWRRVRGGPGAGQ